MIQTLQKCLKSFKVISFKCQNVSGRIDIKLLITIVAENVGSNSSRFSHIFSGCSHCQWSAPTEAAEATPREQKCLGIMSPGAGLMARSINIPASRAGMVTLSLQRSLWNWAKVPSVLLCCLFFLVPHHFRLFLGTLIINHLHTNLYVRICF